MFYFSRNRHFIIVSIYSQSPLTGNTSDGCAYSSIGVSPPWGSPTAAIIRCDGFISLDLWLDGSIIIPFVCHRFHWIYLSMSESWRPILVFAHLARSLQTTKGTYLMCWYLLFKVHWRKYLNPLNLLPVSKKFSKP